MSDLRAQTVTRPRNRLAASLPLLPGEWVDRAACSPATAHLFDDPLSGHHGTAVRLRRRAAAEICADCPVRALCREWAATHDEVGWWAVEMPPPLPEREPSPSVRTRSEEARDRRARRDERTAAERVERADAALARGLTLHDYARREGVALATARGWLRKVGRRDLADALAGTTTTRRQQAAGTTKKET